jgi:hypothetical protein
MAINANGVALIVLIAAACFIGGWIFFGHKDTPSSFQ